MGWQWHQLDHMQIICTLLQTDNHASTYLMTLQLLTFRGVAEAKCILVMAVCVSGIYLCVCLSLAACPHYCTDPDVTWKNGVGGAL